MISIKKLTAIVILAALVLVSSPALAAIQGAADYRSSLVSGITSSATSLAVQSTTTPSGENLVQGAIYGLKLGGREYALGTLGSGKTFTGLLRGVSMITGTTTVAGLSEPWGRGTAVEITDAPVLLEIINKVSGRQSFDNPIRYTGVSTSTLSTDDSNLASVAYVNSVAFGAVPAASETAAGFVELATGSEAAGSTSTGGSGARLVLPGSLATSTYNAATAANRVLVTGGTGKIDNNFIDASTLTGFATTTTIGSFPAYNIGKNSQLFTSTGTTTFSVPSGITKVWVEVQAPGGGGGSCNTTSQTAVGTGGAAGGYAWKVVDVSATSTIQIHVGAAASADTAGTWSTFGTNGSYFYATGGAAGGEGTTPGTPGIGTNGDFNQQGGYGIQGVPDTTTAQQVGGYGGNSFLGFGGYAGRGNAAGGVPGTGYGSGGGGASCSGTNLATGGASRQGFVGVRW